MATISREKARRLGITDRKKLSKEQLREAETKSGQYKEVHGKTFKTDEAGKTTTERMAEERATQTPEDIKKLTQPTIKLEPKETLGQKVFAVASSLKTTAVLGTVLAGLLTMGGSTAAQAGTAVITRTAQIGARTMTTQRAFVGKATTVKALDKIFHTVRPIAARYSVNSKSLGLTTSIFSKAGMSMAAVGIAIGAIGSYPFAGFIKEEAIQTLNIPIQTSIYNGDLEGAKIQIAAVDELINSQGTIMSKIPYLNVLESLGKFFEAAEISNNQWKNIINKVEAEGTAAEKQTATKEKADVEEMTWKAEYYALIRDKKFAEADELLKLKGGM